MGAIGMGETPAFLCACFNEVFGSATPDFYSYDHRLAIQKIAYFLKSLNLAFNEECFGWYIRGPYSVSVASIAYGFMRERPSQDAELSQQQKEALSKLRSWVTKNGAIDLNALELYGSLQYILVGEEKPKENAVELLIGRKAWYKKEETEEALRNLLSVRES